MSNMTSETLSILKTGVYRLENGQYVRFAVEQDAAVSGTLLYKPEDLRVLNHGKKSQKKVFPSVEVTEEKTHVAARRLVEDEGVPDPVLLNFASARNPGGGFLIGARAQEEDLARSSGLYPSLLTQPEYYTANRAGNSALYTDHIIYSPSVPWFRDGEGQLLDDIFLASVITAPAPNAKEQMMRNHSAKAVIEEVLVRRAGYVLAVACARGHRTIVLGAWGCGAFGNDPSMVANVFANQLHSKRFSSRFDLVVFAVYDPRKDRRVLKTFQQRFSP